MSIVSTTTSKDISHPEIRFSALILAAGASGRMGSDKASLPFNGRLSFSKYLVNSYIAAVADPVILVVNENYVHSGPPPKNVKIVVNKELDKGKSHSIQLGINKIPPGNACFIHNVDNPYLEVDLLRTMISNLQPGSYNVPVNRNKGGHPVLLGPEIVEYISSLTEWNDFRKVLGKFQKVEVPWEDDKILLNINNPEEYRRFMMKK
jgi:molybdenum cofactor cytidylyltransferase